MSVSENIFYSKNDISISNSRFIVGSTTYAMNGVTSVKMGKKDPEYGGAITLFVIGIAIMYFWSIWIGLGALALSIILFATLKPTYIVVLNSSSGESQALTSEDLNYIKDVIEALNSAIIHRG